MFPYGTTVLTVHSTVDCPAGNLLNLGLVLFILWSPGILAIALSPWYSPAFMNVYPEALAPEVL